MQKCPGALRDFGPLKNLASIKRQICHASYKYVIESVTYLVCTNSIVAFNFKLLDPFMNVHSKIKKCASIGENDIHQYCTFSL